MSYLVSSQQQSLFSSHLNMGKYIKKLKQKVQKCKYACLFKKSATNSLNIWVMLRWHQIKFSYIHAGFIFLLRNCNCHKLAKQWNSLVTVSYNQGEIGKYCWKNVYLIELLLQCFHDWKLHYTCNENDLRTNIE